MSEGGYEIVGGAYFEQVVLCWAGLDSPGLIVELCELGADHFCGSGSCGEAELVIVRMVKMKVKVKVMVSAVGTNFG